MNINRTTQSSQTKVKHKTIGNTKVKVKKTTHVLLNDDGNNGDEFNDGGSEDESEAYKE